MASASLDIANHSRRAASAAVRTEAVEKTAGRQSATGAVLGKPSLAGLTRDELKEKLVAIGVPERELQDARRAALALDLPARHPRLRRDDQRRQGLAPGAGRRLHARPSRGRRRAGLAGRHAQVAAADAPTGTLDKGAEIECVYIPEVDRGTLCVSSQVGCTLTCSFCHTGTQRLVRNLTHRRNRRAAHRLTRPTGRLAGRCPARRRVRAVRRRTLHIQHRVHGHGRAAL